MARDWNFHKVLAVDPFNPTSTVESANALTQFATYYGVSRTLPTNSEQTRLLAAYSALCEVELPTDDDVSDKVETFATHLRSIYPGSNPSRTLGLPLSAASKFLWVRFRMPVVIYDSIAADYLAKHGYGYDGYAAYFKIWHAEYARHKEQIQEACAALVDAKRFTWASDMADHELRELVNGFWFMERVFDHYVLNDRGMPLTSRDNESETTCENITKNANV